MSDAPGERWQPFLDAVHPTGTAACVHGLGGKAGIWASASACCEAAPDPDLVLLAPTIRQSLTPGWLAQAIEAAAKLLSSDGVLYVLVPWPWHRHVAGLLSRHGFETATPVGHFPGADTACYVQLAPVPLLYALDNLSIARARLYGHAARALLAVGGAGWLSALAPAAGLPAYRRGRPPPFEWLAGHASPAGSAIVATNWYSPGSAAKAFQFADGARTPAAVVKTGRAELSEAVRLQQIGWKAAEAGIRVPRLMRSLRRGDEVRLFETAVPGRPAALVLRHQPGRFVAVVDELAHWLARWSRMTVTTAELTVARREEEMLLPVRTLIDELPRAAAYFKWIAGRSGKLLGRPLPWVAAHNDLTMSNVLSDEHGRLGIVDWNSAETQGYPLGDFWYAAWDALAAARRQGDRAMAFLDCFSAGGRHRQMMAGHEARLRANLGPADDWIELCFHACWLQHAMNERLRAAPGASRPFLAIARLLAQNFDRDL